MQFTAHITTQNFISYSHLSVLFYTDIKYMGSACMASGGVAVVKLVHDGQHIVFLSLIFQWLVVA